MWEWETSVMLITDADGRVLLVHQNYGLRLFGLPGGKVEPGETPELAAVRETEEETGLVVTVDALLGVADLVYPTSGQRYRAFAFSAADVRGELKVRLPDEIAAVGWYDRRRLPEPLTPSASAVLGLPGSEPLLR